MSEQLDKERVITNKKDAIKKFFITFRVLHK